MPLVVMNELLWSWLSALSAPPKPLQPGQRGVDAEHVEEALLAGPGIVDGEVRTSDLEDVVREVTRSAEARHRSNIGRIGAALLVRLGRVVELVADVRRVLPAYLPV